MCTMLGPPWVQKHPQTHLMEYLVLEAEFTEDFETSWATFKEAVPAEGMTAASGAHTPVSKPEASTGTAQKLKDTTKATADTATPDEKNRKKLQMLWRDGTKLKVAYASAVSSFVQLEVDIPPKMRPSAVALAPRTSELRRSIS